MLSYSLGSCPIAALVLRCLKPLFLLISKWLILLVFVNVHYRSKVWGHFEMSLFLKEKHCFFNKDNIKLIKNTHYTLLMW